jgi:hypothetical protein
MWKTYSLSLGHLHLEDQSQNVRYQARVHCLSANERPVKRPETSRCLKVVDWYKGVDLLYVFVQSIIPPICPTTASNACEWLKLIIQGAR